MLFMVIERFRNRDPKPVYRRLREGGRSMPGGLKYIDSWVESNLDRCFQLVETEDARAIQQWVAQWTGLVEFEVIPIVPAKETRQDVEALLDLRNEPNSHT